MHCGNNWPLQRGWRQEWDSSDLKTFSHYGHNVGSKGKEEPLHQPTANTRFCTAKQHSKAEKETVDGGEI